MWEVSFALPGYDSSRSAFDFFVSSTRRHTRCALVTGVQTCALPICSFDIDKVVAASPGIELKTAPEGYVKVHENRSEERRVGKECVRTCRSRWSPYH